MFRMFCQAPSLCMFTCIAILNSLQYSLCVNGLLFSFGSCLALHSCHPGLFFCLVGSWNSGLALKLFCLLALVLDWLLPPVQFLNIFVFALQLLIFISNIYVCGDVFVLEFPQCAAICSLYHLICSLTDLESKEKKGKKKKKKLERKKYMCFFSQHLQSTQNTLWKTQLFQQILKAETWVKFMVSVRLKGTCFFCQL